MKKSRTNIIRTTLILLICVMLIGTTASAGYVMPEFTKMISGSKKFAITSPKKPVKIYVGAYDGKVSVSITPKKKKVVKSAVFNENVETSDGTVSVTGIKLTANKVGKATVTVTYTHSGGTVKRTVTLYTYKWSNPFKTLKIGSKSFKNAFKKTNERTIVPVSGKLKIKMNSRFKKLKVYYRAKESSSFTKIAKSASLNLQSGDAILFDFYDNKNKVNHSQAVFFVR